LLYTNVGPPDCDCLNGANLYDNPDKEEVVDSLNCFYAEDDELTVSQNLRECNGESVEIDETEDTFARLEELADLLTEENYANLDMDLNTSQLTDNYDTLMEALEDLKNINIVTDGTNEEYMDSIGDWIEKFDDLVADLDLDGTWADQSENIQSLIDSAYTTMQEEYDSEEKGKSENKMEWWAWILIALGILCVFVLIAILYVRGRNRKLNRIARGIERDGDYQVDIVHEPVRTGTATGGEGETGM